MKLKQGTNTLEMIYPSGVCVFYSYSTPVAALIPGLGVIKTSEYHSKTTSKHVNKWIKDNFSENVTVSERDQAFFTFLASNPETVTN